MNGKEIQQISEFIKDTQEGLSGQSLDTGAMRKRLSRLHRIIERLMRAALFGSTGGDTRDLISNLEFTARTCRDHIQTRLSAHN